MNKIQLQNDLDCDALISTAKQKRRNQIATLFLPVIITVLWFSLSSPSRQQPLDPTPTVASTSKKPEPAPEAPKAGQLEIIQSDDELLALLADYGPVLVENEDGKQSLFITSPKKHSQALSN